MNYPDLEACKAIASEFPDSEFVWFRYNSETLPAIRDKAEELKEIDDRMHGYADRENCTKILAPAPTCEELGEWLWDNGQYQVERGFNISGTQYWYIEKTPAEATGFKAIDFKLNETQARAEAVKLIVESR